jgi:hypothetical protein
VAEGKGAGASVNGKGLKVAWDGISSEATGTIVARNAGVEEGVEDGIMGCGVETGLVAGAHPDKKIRANSKITRRRFMACKSGEMWVWLLE